MTDYHVDLQLLDDTITRLSGLETFIDEKLAELDRVVSRLHVTWTGEAATAHAAAHREWLAGARRMHEGLTGMRQAAQVAHHNYSGAASANQQTWKSSR